MSHPQSKNQEVYFDGQGQNNKLNDLQAHQLEPSDSTSNYNNLYYTLANVLDDED
jgi:hypothetical protein